MTIVDRYRAVGLASNPFSVELDRSAADRLFVDRQLPSPPTPGSATLVQVLGDRGAGKTTQVLAWRRCVDGPYHYVPPTPLRDRLALPPIAPLVYVDELDRMPAPLRWRWLGQLARFGTTVVAGTHTDLAASARRAGLSTVTHRLGPIDRDTLAQVIQRRMTAASIDQDDPVHLSRSDFETLHRRSGGSVRAALVAAHELVATRVGASGGWHPTSTGE